MRKILFLIITRVFMPAAFCQSGNPWLLNGNTGTNPDSHFIGTIDTTALMFRVSNIPAGEINPVNYRVFLGYNAGRSRTGARNIGIGVKCLFANTTGLLNVGMGSYVLQSNTTGWSNTALGDGAMANNTSGGYNVGCGSNTLLFNTTGSGNVAIGAGSLYVNTTGSYNVAMGWVALPNNITTSYNTAIGSFTLHNTTNSQYNTAIGYNAGGMNNLGWNNTILGANCNINANDRYNCIAIGQAVMCTGNSQARIGNPATVSIGGYVGWSNISDGRYKKDIRQDVKGLDFIMRLQPVTYHLDVAGLDKKLDGGKKEPDNLYQQKAIKLKEEILYSGFVAQDVEKAAKEAGYDFSGVDKPQDKDDLYALRYAEFVVPLVKAVQEQQQIIEDLRNRLNKLENAQNNNPAIGSGDILSVRPNPANDQLFIHIQAENAGGVMIRLYDAKGSAVKEQKATIVRGSNQITLNIVALAKGIYQLSAIWENGQVKTTQVMKQ